MIRARLSTTPLLEAARSPMDLPAGYSVGIENSADEIRISIFKDGQRNGFGLLGPIWGSIELEEPAWDCSGAWAVSLSGAAKGWGPLLYDVALEYTTKIAGGLISDRESVSGEAENIWRYYNTRRSDVKKSQLDDTENTLTPTQKDNCAQGSAEELPEPWHDKKNPLSKIYTKSQSQTMDALKKMGKLSIT